ncbi:hypothetical protein [uncultured Psychroserpens sp.]|uniref:hypothetical protein n=1 Tax=uncultured Psychroserpens sp. TaxID=255436 RepID=UPI0026254B8F|nr:hypothetical protein [uncultured Psychroserpens sp.]
MNIDTPIVLLNLAIIEFKRKNFKNANEFISKVREFNFKLFLKSETDRLENEINAAL